MNKKKRGLIAMGVALGYSNEGIYHYLCRRYNDDYRSKSPFPEPSSVFYGHGYLPTKEEDLDPINTIRLINERRMVSTPFPKLYDREVLGDNLKRLRVDPYVVRRTNEIIAMLSDIPLSD